MTFAERLNKQKLLLFVWDKYGKKIKRTLDTETTKLEYTNYLGLSVGVLHVLPVSARLSSGYSGCFHSNTELVAVRRHFTDGITVILNK